MLAKIARQVRGRFYERKDDGRRRCGRGAHLWSASTVQVGSFRYFSRHKVFEKRPGVGWMLYLPTALSEAQVPEARDLIPVMGGGLQKGTIIVSVIDELFSTDDPEHVKIANSIEVRLADRGLLPLFAEL